MLIATLAFTLAIQDGPTNGLAGYWKLDETAGYYAADSSGNGRALMIVENGGAANPTMLTRLANRSTDVPTVGFADPGSFNFEGGDDHLTIDDSRITGVDDTFTIAFWAKPAGGRTAAVQGTREGLDFINGQFLAVSPISQVRTSAIAGVSVGTNGVTVVESYTYQQYDVPLSHDAALAGWTHVAVVYTNRVPTLYLNGVQVKTGTKTASTTVRPSFNIGSGATGYFRQGGWYQGLLDDIRIYSRALTDTELGGMGNSPPGAATALAQFDAGGATLAPGASSTGSTVVLKGTVHGQSGQQLRLRVEVKPSNQAFSSSGPFVEGSSVGDDQVSSVTLSGLAYGSTFHWRACTLREADATPSAWKSFSTSATAVDFGIRSNAAPAATGAAQWSASSGASIHEGASSIYDDLGVMLDANISDPDGDPVRLETEVRLVSEPFSNVMTEASGWTTGSGRASVSCRLANGGAYHWQYRAVDVLGAAGPWSSFGANGETQADLNLAPVGSLGKAACTSAGLPHFVLLPAILVLAAIRRPSIFR